MYCLKATILFIHVGLMRTVTLGHDSLEGGVVEKVVNTILEFNFKLTIVLAPSLSNEFRLSKIFTHNREYCWLSIFLLENKRGCMENNTASDLTIVLRTKVSLR